MQALVDFTNKYNEESEEIDIEHRMKRAENKHDVWELNVDEAANPERSSEGNCSSFTRLRKSMICSQV